MEEVVPRVKGVQPGKGKLLVTTLGDIKAPKAWDQHPGEWSADIALAKGPNPFSTVCPSISIRMMLSEARLPCHTFCRQLPLFCCVCDRALFVTNILGGVLDLSSALSVSFFSMHRGGAGCEIVPACDYANGSLHNHRWHHS